MGIDLLTEEIIGAGIAVHRELGPGLLESVYEACMVIELGDRGLRVERQKEVDVIYRGKRVGPGFRIDLLVNDRVVVELKSVAALDPVHAAQVLTYLKLTGYPVGLIMNFNVQVLKEGIRRLVRNLPELPQRSPRSLR